MAAFSNTVGGRIIFGIDDKPRRLIGVDPEVFPDTAFLEDKIKQVYSPTPIFDVHDYEISGLVIVVIEVSEHRSKPSICLKSKNKETPKGQKVICREGAIYVRKSAQISEISPTELSSIIDERIQKQLLYLSQSLKVIDKIGAEKIGILDASKAASPSDKSKLYISRESAENLNFIHKGRFVETLEEGDPAYVVLGEINLHDALKIPDNDGVKPGVVSAYMKPIIQSVYDPLIVPFSATQVYSLVTCAGLDSDDQYCYFHEPSGSRYYRSATEEKLKSFIIENPRKALSSFSSKLNRDAYDRMHRYESVRVHGFQYDREIDMFIDHNTNPVKYYKMLDNGSSIEEALTASRKS